MSAPQAGSNGGYSSRSVHRVCDILDTLAAAPLGASLTEVADATSMPKSSAFRYLVTLQERAYVERDAEGSLFRLGQLFHRQHDTTRERLSTVAQQPLEKLRDQLRETTNLGVLEGTYVIHELVVESPEIMRVAARPGERGLVHSTALGKVMTAGLPLERVKTILDSTGLPAITKSTITDMDALWAELQRVRDQGYAVDDAENQEGGRCVAVAIPRIPFPAGVSVSAPTGRLAPADVPGVARKLAAVAAVISRHFNS